MKFGLHIHSYLSLALFDTSEQALALTDWVYEAMPPIFSITRTVSTIVL